MSVSRALLVAALVALVVTTGCILSDVGSEPPGSSLAEAEAEAGQAGAEEAEGPPVHTLSVRAWDGSELADILRVEDVEADPIPQPIQSFQLGPAEQASMPVTLARFNVTEGHRLESFRLELTVDDGLGPAQLSLEVPAWTARQDAQVNVHLELVEVGEVRVARVDGDLAVDVLEDEAQPRYGYIVWPQGNRQPLDGLDRIVHVPEPFPRFAAGAEPVFATDEPVRWTLDGDAHGTGEEIHADVGPGRHTLTLADPEGGGEAEIVFSIHDRFAFQGAVTAGSLDHRGSVAGVNEDTYNVSAHDSARSLVVRLEPVGNQTELENLDLYALNETGGVLGQSTGNATEEIMRLSRGDLADVDEVQIRVHGEKAALTEYRLSGTVFYWPW